MTAIAIEAFFLGPSSQRRYALLTAPQQMSLRGAILFVHGFAEELNKSRRMVSLAARELASDGYATLQIDLHGCGDSSGDFSDATWDSWITDILTAHEWLRARTGRPTCIWGMRAGALLAASALPKLTEVPRLILWQPVLSGAQHLRQFLRLKVTNSMLAGGESAGGSKALLSALASGNNVEVAGYVLPSALADSLDKARLDTLPPTADVVWLEVTASEPAVLAPTAVACIAAWRAAGTRVDATAMKGPQFWQTQEIEECPALVAATRAAFRQGPS